MANMFDYLKWRGDLTLQQSSFCHIDNLLLATLSYLNLEGLTSIGLGEYREIQAVAEEFFQIHSLEELENQFSLHKQAPDLLAAMAHSERFGTMKIGNYINIIDEEKRVQFSMVEYVLSDDTTYLAFRGTDETLIGWKEDFYLCIGSVLAEKAASVFLKEIAGMSQRPLRIGGHSKGGYLAYYAAVKSPKEVRDRILAIYSNDGPGYSKDFLEEAKEAGLKDRLVRIVPEISVVGNLFLHDQEPLVVDSDQKGFLQHDSLSWQLEGKEFLYKEEIHPSVIRFHKKLDQWLEGMTAEQKEQFIEDIFDVLESTGCKTLGELYDGGWKYVKTMMQRLRQMDQETKDMILALLRILIQK